LSITLGEKVSLKYTGLITSFPTIVALVILFIGLGQGPEAAQVAAFKISHAIVLFNIWMLFYLLFLKLSPYLTAILSLALYCLSGLVFYAAFSTVPVFPWAYVFYLIILISGFWI